MNIEETKLFLEKVESILSDFNTHKISWNYDVFGGITVKELACIAKQIISDQGFNKDDYFLINNWEDNWEDSWEE